MIFICLFLVSSYPAYCQIVIFLSLGDDRAPVFAFARILVKDYMLIPLIIFCQFKEIKLLVVCYLICSFTVFPQVLYICLCFDFSL